MKYRMIDALKSKYEAAYKEASTTLEIYLTKPVAIGEHPQHFEEMDKLVSAMTDANDKLDTLKKEFPRIEPKLLNE
jgi:hypothetical protein|tara:strand:- start:662 stop:889 length:228 start_codon:yes stop_codon:yes gene_type:complete